MWKAIVRWVLKKVDLSVEYNAGELCLSVRVGGTEILKRCRNVTGAKQSIHSAEGEL